MLSFREQEIQRPHRHELRILIPQKIGPAYAWDCLIDDCGPAERSAHPKTRGWPSFGREGALFGCSSPSDDQF